MAKEHSIVDYINTRLQAAQFSAKRFQQGDFKGVAELYNTGEGEDNASETKPGVSDNSGEVSYVGIDDTYPFQIYHRVIEPSAEWNIEQEFGDAKAIKETTNMLMVVIGDRNRLKLTAEDIKTGIVAALPLELPESELITLGLKSAIILPGSFNWNRESVYNEEFNLKENMLKTSTIIFSFSYQIETEYDQTCFTLCE
jgi:hypothetical protein